MPITLAEAKATMQDKLLQLVIDEFRRESRLLDLLTFDDSVSPGTGGSTLTYSYTRLKTPSTAGARAINGEYTANEAKREKASTDLKIFGGAFEIDRVIQDTSGALNEIDFQLKEKIKGARNYFHYQAINGDEAADDKTFDGLNKILTGSSTEQGKLKSEIIDLSATVTKDTALALLEQLDNFLSILDGKPDAIMGNTKLINKLKAAARVAGYITASEDAFGRTVEGYNGIEFIDLGDYYNGTTTVPVVPIVSRDFGTTEDPDVVAGLTDLYAVSFGLDALHGATPQGGVGMKAYLPDLNSPGAVKKGEVEMVAGVVLKKTLKAAVRRNIKVQ